MMERVVARDGETGEWVETSVIVRRRTFMALSCSCWRHCHPWGMEVIETLGGMYFRAGTPDHPGEIPFREIGHHGPITIEVTKMVRELE